MGILRSHFNKVFNSNKNMIGIDIETNGFPEDKDIFDDTEVPINPTDNKFNKNYIELLASNYAKEEINNIWFNERDDNDCCYGIPLMTESDLYELMKFLLARYYNEEPKDSFMFTEKYNQIDVGGHVGFDDGCGIPVEELPEFMKKYLEGGEFSGLWCGHVINMRCELDGTLIDTSIAG